MNTSKERKNYREAREQWLIKPIPARRGECYGQEITLASPLWQKTACIQIRRYLAIECGCGFNWDTSDDGWQDVVVLPFTEDNFHSQTGECVEMLIGAAGFCYFSDVNAWWLSFVWIHPFFRNRKLVRSAYPEWLDRFGDFSIEMPVSKAFQAVIRKYGTDNQKKYCQVIP